MLDLTTNVTYFCTSKIVIKIKKANLKLEKKLKITMTKD